MPDLVEGGRQRPVDRIAGESPHDMPGDLEVVELEPPEHRECRHPAAAMLERGLAAGDMEPAQEVGARRGVGDHRGLADLEAQRPRLHLGSGERFMHQLHRIAAGDGLVREIDRHGGRLHSGVRLPPFGQLPDRLLDDPPIDARHEPIPTRGGKEGPGRERLAALVDQSEQQLEAGPAALAVVQRHDGLGIKPEAVFLDGPQDPPRPLVVVPRVGGPLARSVQLNPIASAALGEVAGGVRSPEHVARPPDPCPDGDDADARLHRIALLAEREAVCGDRLADLVRDPLCRRQPAMLQQHAELIAPQACQGIARSHPLEHQVAQLSQQLVPGQVAAGVIDPLETVQVEKTQRVLAMPLGGTRQRTGEPPLELAAVHQAGERVVGRLVGELPRDGARMGHVPGDDRRPDDRSGRIADRRRGEVERAAFLPRGRVQHSFAGATGCPAAQAPGDRALQRLTARFAGERQHLAQRSAARRIPGPPRKRLGGAVHEVDVAVGVGRENGVRDRVERAHGLLRAGDCLLDAGGRDRLVHDGHHQPIGRADDRRERDLDWEFGSVRPESHEPAPGAHGPHGGCRSVRGTGRGVPLAEALGEQGLDRLAAKLAGGGGEHGLRPVIEHGDGTRAIDQQYCVGRRVEQRLEFRCDLLAVARHGDRAEFGYF